MVPVHHPAVGLDFKPWLKRVYDLLGRFLPETL